MAEFEDIWQFVENNMKIRIPPYIKYVLRFCGYENCHTISTIEETDIEYFESEVRNGGIIEFYKDEVTPEDLFKGSTKTVKDFEINRGHRKLMMAAVKVVKEKLEENGVENFFASPKRKTKIKVSSKTTEENVARAPVRRKKQKFSPSELLGESLDELEEQSNEMDYDTDPHIKHHKRVLYMKALMCLKNHDRDIYEKKLQLFKNKLSEDTMQLKKKSPESMQYTAKMKCPHCEDNVVVFHKLSNSEFGSWNAFNFERHLLKKHKTTTKDDGNERAIEVETDDSSEDGAKKDVPAKLDLTSVHSTDVASEIIQSDTNDFIFVVVPPPTRLNEVGDRQFEEIENVMIEDFSICGKESDVNLSDISGAADEILQNLSETRIFKNGGETQDGSWDETKRIITRKTCAFYSIFAIYASRYLNDPNFRAFLDTSSLVFQSKFSSLVNLYFEANSSTPKLTVSEISSAWKTLNRERNILLKEIFSTKYYEPNLTIDKKITTINCETGLGEFFAHLANQNEILSSAIVTSTCKNCKITQSKAVPFFAIDDINLDLKNIQRSIDSNIVKNRFCKNCKSKITIEKTFNKMLVIDIEPSRDIQKRKTFALQNLSRTIEVDKESVTKYKLCAVIEHDPVYRHFIAHVKYENDEWIMFDDLQNFGIKSNCTEDLLPFMVFYLSENSGSNFKKTFFTKI